MKARHSSPIEKVLAQLCEAKQRQPGQWSACCPAHPGDIPNLSIRETPDGAVLLQCLDECAPGSVLAALGLDAPDLHAQPHRSGNEPARLASLLCAEQVLEVIGDAAILVARAAANVAHGVVLGMEERARLIVAAQRIGWLKEEALPLSGFPAHRCGKKGQG